MSRATWPTVLDELATVIGEELTLRLAEAEGGVDRVYIPKEPTTDHPWASIIGAEAWEKLVLARGGDRIDLPRGTFINLKKARIIELAEQGLSHREIARQVRTAERYVRHVLGAGSAKPDPRQIDLPLELEPARNSSGQQ